MNLRVTFPGKVKYLRYGAEAKSESEQGAKSGGVDGETEVIYLGQVEGWVTPTGGPDG